MPELSRRKREEMQAKFTRLDTNGDGTLSCQEMSNLLRKGDKHISDDEVQKLYDGIDLDGNGAVSFDEFISYLYGDAPSSGQAADWGGVENTFRAFSGPDLQIDGREYLRMCQQCKLIGKGFPQNHVDTTFGAVAGKKKKIGFDDFKRLLEKVAVKRGMPLADVQNLVAAVDGPHANHVTKTQQSRFHDDKSSYTGSHTHNEKHGDAGTTETEGDRHDRLHREHEAEADETEGDWTRVDEQFTAFSGTDMDRTEFCKVCHDSNIYCKKFSKTDAELLFGGVVRKGERRINMEEFHHAIRKIAKAKKCPISEVQDAIGLGSGPVLKGTEGGSRFHDDKTTYTGMHQGK